jgi:hypothetical protein
MRNTKFRGKVFHYGRDCGWVFGDFYRYYNGNLNYTIATLGEFETKEYSVEISTVGQWTGLHDKNGKEIYEGDIVKHDAWDYPFTVIFDQQKARFVCQLKTGLTNHIHCEGIQVVGNIFDNPDLVFKTMVEQSKGISSTDDFS